ncbi:hypothetical protein GCM10009623_32670 [Nocardioides aestuarii]
MDEERTSEVTPRQWRGLSAWGGIAAVAFACLSIGFLVWFASDPSDGMRLVFGVAFAIPAIACAYIAVRSGTRS